MPTPSDLVQRITNAAQQLLGTLKKAPTANWLTVRNEGDSAVMTISGSIGKSWYDPSGIASKDFKNELKKIPTAKPLEVRIHSPGGSVGDALDIYNALRERGNVTCINDGYALSAASVILCAGKSVVPKTSVTMLHLPLTGTEGNRDEHQKTIEMLDKVGGAICEAYMEKTGKTKDEIMVAMQKETWLTGQEAVDFGIADELKEDDGDGDNDAQDRFASLDLSSFRNVPANVVAMFKPTENQDQESAPVVSEISTVENGGPATNKPNPNMPEPITAPVAAAPAVNAAEFAQLKAQLQAEKKARIEAKIDGFIGQCRLTNDERTDAVARSMADESYLDIVAKRPQVHPGGAPLSHDHNIEVLGTVAEQIKAEGNIEKRYAMRKQHWEGLLAHAQQQEARGSSRGLPVAANTLTASLVTDFLTDGAISKLVGTFAPLKAFSREFSQDRYKPLATHRVRLTSSGGTTQKATKSAPITDYEANSDSEVDAVTVDMAELSKAFGISSSDLNSGLRMEHLVERNIDEFASDVLLIALAPLNTANFTAGSVSAGTISAHAGTWAWSVSGGPDMTTLRAALGKSRVKNAILDPVLFSRIINQPGFFQVTDPKSGSGVH